jgi:hypothetical protein
MYGVDFSEAGRCYSDFILSSNFLGFAIYVPTLLVSASLPFFSSDFIFQ